MNAHNLRSWRVLPALVVVLSLLASGIAMAGAPEAGPTIPESQVLDPAAPNSLDDGYLDVGAEYSSATVPPGKTGALPYTSDSAWHFYNKMRAAGYTGSDSFIYGNSLAWETDWKRAALGGSENAYVDDVDIMFFHDHGGTGGMWFPWDHTDEWVVPNDCYGSWGDRDVEWIGIKSCLTLADSAVVGWASCMNGIHLIAGMVPVSYGADFGGDWADQLLGLKFWGIWLRSPKTVTQAWFTACDANQPSSVKARVIAEDWRHFDDKVHGRGGPVYGDIVNWPKYYRDHWCYKPPATQVDVDALVAAPVNTYVVEQRTVDEAYAQGVANSLGLEGDVQCPPGGTECGLVSSEGGQSLSLSIDTASGGFVLQNTDQLWAAQDPSLPLSLPGPDAAIGLAGSYLDSHQALPGSSNVNMASAHYESDTQTEVTVVATAAGAAQVLQDTQNTGVLVAYGRSLATGVQSASGAMIDVGTVGPGSATKVYYGGASGALRGPNQEQLPIGLAGGSRDVNTGATTTPKAYDASWAEFLADHQLAVVPIPLDWDTAELVGQTFSYYEQPQGVPQEELIPVWVFTADLYKDSALVADDATIYVPANNDYYPPNVTIDAPTADSTIVAGQWIDLMGTSSGGYDPFTYEWSSSTQGTLVKGDQEDVKGFLLGGSAKEGESTSVVITLKATNQNGQSREVQVSVNVLGQPMWLPLIRK